MQADHPSFRFPVQSFLILPEKVESARRLSSDAFETSEPDEAKGKLALEEINTPIKAIIKGGSFGWDDKTAVLEGIDLELTPGQLHMVCFVPSFFSDPRNQSTSFFFSSQVVGSVASGKTTLLMTLLGESVQQKGSIDVQARKVSSRFVPPPLVSTIHLD